MNIIINGEEKIIAQGTTIAALVAELQLAPTQFAVEVNGRIVRKPEHPTTLLNQGDKVEIVRFIGGG